MTSAILETSSREDGKSPTGLQNDDWVYPKPLEDWDVGETTAAESDASINTLAREMRKVSKPIRKNNLVVQFPSDNVRLLQQWECVISRVHKDCVECELHDLTDESQAVEWAEVYLEEFNHFDRPLLSEGAVFYWSIGYETKITGQVRRYSELRVRRMPPLSKTREREINAKAKQLSELFAKQSPPTLL